MTEDMTEAQVLTDEEGELIRRLAEARSARSQWEKEEKALRGQVITALRGHNASRAMLASGAPAAHITKTVRHSVDSKKLQALYPDVYADVIRETEVETLNIDL
jgi:hypothetical protein